MYHHYDEDFGQFDLPQIIDDGEGSFNTHHILFPKDIPAWSLSALLEFMNRNDYDMALKYCGAEYTMSFDNGERYKSITKDYAIDAAFEMVCYLLEHNKI